MPAAADSLTIRTEGMVCQVCAQTIEAVFLAEPGVTACQVLVEEQRVEVTTAPESALSETRVAELMTAAGFPALAITRHPQSADSY